MKNILFPFEYNIKVGGAQKSILEIVKNSKNNFFFLLPQNGDYGKCLEEIGVKVYYGGMKDYWPFTFKRPFSTIINIFFIVIAINKIVQKERIDIVHVTMVPSMIAAVLAKILFRLNYKIIWHDRAFYYKWYTIRIIRWLIPFLDRIISTTDKGKLKLVDYGIDSKKIDVIYNSTSYCNQNKNYNKLYFTNKAKIALIARISRIKGHLQYINIINYIVNVKKYQNAVFYIVGDVGTDKDDEKYLKEIKDKISEYKLDKFISFTGNINDINSFLKEIDIVCCTTLYPGESFGRMIIEAFSNYIPVIAFSNGAVSDIIDKGINGFLINDDNVIEFGEKIILLLNNESLLKEMGLNGFNKVFKLYNAEVNNNKINKLYEELC